MGIPTTLRGISATAGSNSPAGTDVIGSTADDYLRSIQSVFRQYLASVASNIASATTADLSTADGFWVTITGTTTITALGTEQAGIWYGLIFNGTLTFTHNGTSLILPGGANITTQNGDSCFAESLGSGNWKIHAYQKASGGSPVPVRGALAGLTLSTAGSSSTMTTAAGQATDSTNAVTMTLASSIGKTTSAWAVGTGNGGLDTGAIANSTWYHFYEIMRPDTGVVDVLFSLSATAPTMPTNYTYKRRIGSGKTDGSAQWVAFVQKGDLFLLKTLVQDIAQNNPGSGSAWVITHTLASIPTGVQVEAYFSHAVNSTTVVANVLVNSLDQNDLGSLPIGYATAGTNSLGAAQVGPIFVRTNTSAQVRSRGSNCDGNTTFYITIHGWRDYLGRLD